MICPLMLSGVLKSPTIILLLITSSMFVINYFKYLGAPMLSAYIFTIVTSGCIVLEW